jgi:hypothetical protein
LKVAKKWSRDSVTLLQDSMADGIADSEADWTEWRSDIGFCCKSGTHRAPAAARIIREMLVMDGYKTNQPRHLSFGTWTARGRCHWCHQCVLDNPNKQALFEIAYAKWCTF